MNKKAIVSLIHECIVELLNEDQNLDSSRRKEKEEYTDYLNAKKQTIDAELSSMRDRNSLNVNEEELDEMARLPTTYKVADDADEKLKNLRPDWLGSPSRMKWINGIINYIKDQGESDITSVARDYFQKPQPAIAEYARELIRMGVLEPATLPQPKYKPKGDGIRGRKPGKLTQTTRSVYDKIRNGRENEITPEEREILGTGNIEKIKDKILSGKTSKPSEPKFNEPESSDLDDLKLSDMGVDDNDEFFEFGKDDEFGGLFEEENNNNQDKFISVKDITNIRVYPYSGGVRLSITLSPQLEELVNQLGRDRYGEQWDDMDEADDIYDEANEQLAEKLSSYLNEIGISNEIVHDMGYNFDDYQVQISNKDFNILKNQNVPLDESIKQRWQKLANIKVSKKN